MARTLLGTVAVVLNRWICPHVTFLPRLQAVTVQKSGNVLHAKPQRAQSVGVCRRQTHAHEAKRFTALQSGGLGVANPRNMLLFWFFCGFAAKGSTTEYRGVSSTGLTQGLRGDCVPSQPHDTMPSTMFRGATPQKNQNKKGFGAVPQWEISVSFMRMDRDFDWPR